jgi:hypothetical protein
MYKVTKAETRIAMRHTTTQAIRANNPDLLGAQEVENMAGTVAAALGSDYRVAGESSAGHTVIYRQSALSLDSWATAELHEQDQWGPRTLEWAMFTHKASGRKVPTPRTM